MIETVEACLTSAKDQHAAAQPEATPRVIHSEPETIWHKLDHLLYLPLLGLCRPRDLYYYQGQGLNVLQGFTYKYLTLEHFLGELTQLQVGYPLADALAALRTLLLNGGWDLYWQKRQVLPLAVPIGP